MLVRFRLGTVPHLAALVLLLGIVLGGAVDAVACEPIIETAAVTAVAADAADPGSGDQAPGQERHADCIHGHCHHGAQQLPSLALQVVPPAVSVEHLSFGESSLASLSPSSLKRPPRA